MDDRVRVFVSYSRKDLEFVKRLSADLRSRGTLCDFDVTDVDPNNVSAGLAAEDEWWKRLQEMITRAHVVVFVVSSHSMQSRMCDEEVAFARAAAKRVIAVSNGPLDFSALPPRLAALNIAIGFRDSAEPVYADALNRLTAAIQLDVHWHRTAADVAVAAQKWDGLGRGDEVLAIGAELEALQSWAARRPSSAPPHSALVLAYLSASQHAGAERLAVVEAERARFLELMEIAKPLVEEEIRAREAQPPSEHPGVRKEQEAELERLRSLVGDRWHPLPSRHVHSTGAVEGYAEIFTFPCCNIHIRDFLGTGAAGDAPSQFRSDGCQRIPERLRHNLRERLNPFRPLIRYVPGDRSDS